MILQTFTAFKRLGHYQARACIIFWPPCLDAASQVATAVAPLADADQLQFAATFQPHRCQIHHNMVYFEKKNDRTRFQAVPLQSALKNLRHQAAAARAWSHAPPVAKVSGGVERTSNTHTIPAHPAANCFPARDAAHQRQRTLRPRSIEGKK